MTAQQFQREYHDYCVTTMEEAQRDAAVINQQLEPNPLGPVVAVDFSPYGFGLMLEVPALTIPRRVQ